MAAFTWDPRKARANQRKHGVSFEPAARVFSDPLALSKLDDSPDYDEVRWITMGQVDGAILLVAHTDPTQTRSTAMASASSRRAKRPNTSAATTKKAKRVPAREIDLSDIPEQLDWSTAKRGKFYRPLKQPVTLRIDMDVLAWFKEQGEGYQTRMNEVLRRYVAASQRKD